MCVTVSQQVRNSTDSGKKLSKHEVSWEGKNEIVVPNNLFYGLHERNDRREVKRRTEEE